MENKRKKILFLTKYSQKGASSRYRSFLYEIWFSKNGIEPKYSPLFGDIYLEGLYKKSFPKKVIGAIRGIISRIFVLLFWAKKYDFVVIEKELFPKIPLIIELFLLKGIKYSLDYDDNIANNYIGTSLESKIPKLMQNAQFISVGNHWYMHKFRGNMIYIPTVVDMEDYPLYSKQEDKLSIVWIGSPSTEKYLKIVERVLENLSERYDFILKIIGGNIKLSPKIRVEYIPWSKDKENQYLAQSSIGIMPLENTEWEKGKCGFKLIQYMASGIPVVASALPANEEIIKDEVGFIVQTEKEWEEKLSLLFDDQFMRKTFGENGRKRIEKHYSYQIWGEKYSKILKNEGSISLYSNI